MEFVRLGSAFFDIMGSVDIPSSMVRVSAPTGTDPFLCESIQDYLYWRGEGKTKLWVYPMAKLDPPVVYLDPTIAQFWVLRAGIIYVGSDAFPQAKDMSVQGICPFSFLDDNGDDKGRSFFVILCWGLHLMVYPDGSTAGKALVVQHEKDWNKSPIYPSFLSLGINLVVNFGSLITLEMGLPYQLEDLPFTAKVALMVQNWDVPVDKNYIWHCMPGLDLGEGQDWEDGQYATFLGHFRHLINDFPNPAVSVTVHEVATWTASEDSFAWLGTQSLGWSHYFPTPIIDTTEYGSGSEDDEEDDEYHHDKGRSDDSGDHPENHYYGDDPMVFDHQQDHGDDPTVFDHQQDHDFDGYPSPDDLPRLFPDDEETSEDEV